MGDTFTETMHATENERNFASVHWGWTQRAGVPSELRSVVQDAISMGGYLDSNMGPCEPLANVHARMERHWKRAMEDPWRWPPRITETI